MQQASPGFRGEQLRAAREVRGLRAISLADLVGVSPGTISQWESGLTTPRAQSLEAIARILDVPTRFFFDEPAPIETQAIFYRSLSSATKQARARAEGRHQWRQRITNYLREYVEVPEPNIPDFNAPTDPRELQEQDIEDLAIATRRAWGLGDGPISHAVRLLENQGVIIARDDLDTHTLDGFSLWSRIDDTPYIVLARDKASHYRSRTDVFHELGHIILHRNVPRQLANQSPVFKLMENQAFYFAGAFAMPASSFGKEVRSINLDSLLSLKVRWHAALAAMLKRIDNLGLTTENRLEAQWKALSRKGWKKREPFDDEVLPEEPSILRSAMLLVIEAAVRDVRDITNDLPYSPHDIESLCGLPHGVLSPTQIGTVTPLEIRQHYSEQPAERNKSDAAVVEFPLFRRLDEQSN